VATAAIVASVVIAAFGVAVNSTIPGGGYAYFSGTSMATQAPSRSRKPR